MAMLLLVVAWLDGVWSTGHIRWRSESSVEIGGLPGGVPARSRMMVVGAPGGERVSEVDAALVDAAIGIHVVRRQCAGHGEEVSLVEEGAKVKKVM